MKIGVIGAGISGLSIAKLLGETHEVEVIEKNSIIGGIAKTKQINNASYHLIGGHCFNSKHKEVLDFVFNQVMPKNEWHKIIRNAAIRFKDHEINYPIEFSVKQIADFDNDLAIRIVKDFLNAKDDGEYSNLAEWFKKKFGNTLTNEYFLPYNKKIWNKDPKEIDPSWVEDKLPIPNVESFFKSLIDSSKDKMPHQEFYYPKSNNQNTFINNLAFGINVKLNTDVTSINYDLRKSKYCINDSLYYDKIISTMPLNIIPKFILNSPIDVLEAGEKLKYNKISTMLWVSMPTERTWTYIPDSTSIFHRYIHIGNFFKPIKNLTITECIGDKTFDEMKKAGEKDSFLIKPLSHNVSDHAYVVYDSNYKHNKEIILKYLDSIGIYSLGRFGQWDYFNMDICIKKALELKKIIKNE